MEIIVYIWRRSPGRLLLVAGIGIIAGTVNSILFALMNASLQASGNGRYIAAFIGLALLVILTNTLPEILLSPLTRGVSRDLRGQLARAITSTPLRRLEEIGRGRVSMAFEQDLPALVQAATGFPLAITNVTVIIGCMAYLLWLSPLAFAVVFPIAAGGSFLHATSMRLVAHSFGRLRTLIDALGKRQDDLLTGVKELKLNAPRRRAFFERCFDTSLDAVRVSAIQMDRVSATLTNVGYSYNWLCLGSALFLVPLLVPDASIARGALLVVLYTSGLTRFVGDFSRTIALARVALSRVKDLQMSLSPQAPEAERAASELAKPARKTQEITVRGVEFAYPPPDPEGHGFVVGPFDLHVASGDLVFIVGGNGSGKTTFAKLLCGLYRPTRGDIIWNGEVVTEDTIEAYRNTFAAVFTEFHVFEDLLTTEAINIDDHARELLEKLGLANKVRVRDGKLSSVDLSTGQRKRLALLVALLDDRPFYLFDEWAADQDPEFRAVFYQEFLAELARRDKGVVVITHDDRYFHLAHRVVKLADGRIETQNTRPPRDIAKSCG